MAINVIKRDRLVRNTKIATSRYTNPASEYNNAVAQFGSVLHDAAYKEAQKQAIKKGKTTAQAVSSKQLAIDPETGKPIAYSIDVGGGRLGQESFEATIQQQFLQDYQNKITEKANKEYYSALENNTGLAVFENNVSNFAQSLVDSALPEFKEPVLKIGAGVVTQQGRLLLADKARKNIDAKFSVATTQIEKDTVDHGELVAQFGPFAEQVTNSNNYYNNTESLNANSNFINAQDPSFISKNNEKRRILTAGKTLTYIHNQLRNEVEFSDEEKKGFDRLIKEMLVTDANSNVIVKEFNQLTKNKFAKEINFIFKTSTSEERRPASAIIQQVLGDEIADIRSEEARRATKNRATAEKIKDAEINFSLVEIGQKADDFINKELDEIVNDEVYGDLSNALSEKDFGNRLIKSVLAKNSREIEDLPEAEQLKLKATLQTQTVELQDKYISRVINATTDNIFSELVSSKILDTITPENQTQLNMFLDTNGKQGSLDFIPDESIIKSLKDLNTNLDGSGKIGTRYKDNLISSNNRIKSSITSYITNSIREQEIEKQDRNNANILLLPELGVNFVTNFTTGIEQRTLSPSDALINFQEKLETYTNKAYEKIDSSTLSDAQKIKIKNNYNENVAHEILSQTISSMDNGDKNVIAEFISLKDYIAAPNSGTFNKLSPQLQQIVEPLYENINTKGAERIAERLSSVFTNFKPRVPTPKELTEMKLLENIRVSNFKDIVDNDATRESFDKIISSMYEFDPNNPNLLNNVNLIRTANVLPKGWHNAIDGLLNGNAAELESASSILQHLDLLMSMPNENGGGNNRTVLKTLGLESGEIQQLNAILDTVDIRNASANGKLIKNIINASIEIRDKKDPSVRFTTEVQTDFNEKLTTFLKKQGMRETNISSLLNKNELYFETLARALTMEQPVGELPSSDNSLSAMMFNAYKNNFKKNYHMLGPNEMSPYGETDIFSDRTLATSFATSKQQKMYESMITYEMNNLIESGGDTIFLLAEDYDQELNSIPDSDAIAIEEFKKKNVKIYVAALNNLGTPVFTALIQNADNTMQPLIANNKNGQASVWQWNTTIVSEAGRLKGTSEDLHTPTGNTDILLRRAGQKTIVERMYPNDERVKYYLEELDIKVDSMNKSINDIPQKAKDFGNKLGSTLKEFLQYGTRSLR